MTTSSDLVTLKDYIDMRFEEIEKARSQAFLSMDKRLEGMNEFRAQLKDQTQLYLTRGEYEGKHEALDAKIHTLEISKATLEGKASQNSVIFSVVIAVFGVLLSIFALFEEFIR